MINYELLPGVVLLSVAKEHLLVADKEARKKVGYILQINDAGAYYWKLMEQGLDLREIVRRGSCHFSMDSKQTIVVLDNFMKKLNKAGYLKVERV